MPVSELTCILSSAYKKEKVSEHPPGKLCTLRPWSLTMVIISDYSLVRLGIRVMYAKPRSGKSKGKIEKFHQVVDAFIRESKLKNIKTLEELNRLWFIYLDEYYYKKKHDGIAEYYESLGAAIPEEGITPLQEWNRDSRPLTFLDITVVAEAFLHHEQRKVDKGACISFHGQRYETKPALIGYTVEISYDHSIFYIVITHVRKKFKDLFGASSGKESF